MGATPWEVLGVDRSASQAEVKRAYRRMALKEHPDVSKAPDAKQRWQEVSAAYDTLMSPDKLRDWERSRRGGSTSAGASSTSSRSRASTSSGARVNYGQWKRTAAMEEEYDAKGDSFSSIFSDLLEAVGQEVAGSPGGPVGKVGRVGAMLLEDLLEYLERNLGETGAAGATVSGYDGSRPDLELQEARLELSTMEQREEVLRAEAEAWERKAELCKAAGDRVGELDGMQRCFDARERRSKIRRRILSITERVEYLQKVVFEYERKKQQRASAPPPSSGRRAGSSSVGSQRPPFDADAALAELKRKRGGS